MKKIMIILLLGQLLYIPTISKAAVIDSSKPYSYKEYQQDVWLLKSKYKDRLQLETIGTSEYGRKLYAIHLGSGKKNILMIGSHHGREWITSLLLMNMVENYASSSNLNKELADVSIWFVPMLNPDGVTIQQGEIDKFPFFAKRNIKKMNEGSTDFSKWKSNGLGIDLNRQYSAGWDELYYASKRPSYKNYKGHQPFEAKEVKAIVEFTEKIKPSIAISYHSSGQEIYWQYKNGEYTERDRKIAEKISAATGYKLGVPDEDAIGAGYTDWFIDKYKLPALTIEICPLIEETNPPLHTFPEEWKRNKEIPKILIQEVKKLEEAHKK
ncbi:M14 family zinc carboxypeptidase [Niallia sp. NCCP-28]|uniref:M14 family zinc carboxypeptidase n=1 Tax=Niallia sp. NCCP-28 TaxID=2934712 RepID=UPI0020C046DD|nr:M14 family zinc carboxypeptidase [Niallia sp. NCCP-28]